MDGLLIRNVADLEWTEVRAQQHGDRRASVWIRFVQVVDERAVMHTRYDPGFVLPRHAHQSDEVIHVLGGEVTIGDTPCPAGSVVILEAGTWFGPLIAGPEGAEIFEVFTGTSIQLGDDWDGFDALLASRGIEQLPNPEFTLPAT